MNEVELVCFQIIKNVNHAKQAFNDAIASAKFNDFEQANRLIKEGSKYFNLAHQEHSKCIQKEANGEISSITLLLMHAEDQLTSCESIKMMTNEIIDLRKELLLK